MIIESVNRFFSRFKYQTVEDHYFNQSDQDELPSSKEASIKLQLLAFFSLGISMLLPWNALILALPFYDDIIPYSSFASALSASFTIPNFLTLAFATLTHSGSDLKNRVKNSLMLMTIPLSALGFLAYISSTFKPSFIFVSVIACTTCTSIGSAYMQSAGTALASLYGPSHLKAIFTGQGLVAVIVSVFQLLFQLLSNSQENDVATANVLTIFISFITSTIILLITYIIFHFLSKSPTFIEMVSNNRFKKPAKQPLDLFKQANSRVWHYGVAILLDFAVTLSIFPTVTVLVRSSKPIGDQPMLLTPSYFPLIHFITFNLADLAGRALPSLDLPQRFKKDEHHTIHITFWKSLVIFATVRLIFIPLFLAYLPNTALSLKRDWVFFFLLAIFGLSNGYIATLVFTSGTNEHWNEKLLEPLSVNENEEHNAKDMGASVLVFYLTGGLSIGSILSFIVPTFVNNINVLN